MSDARVYSVTSLTAALKNLITTSPLAAVFVEGEISGWKVYPSGHAYFTLKDSGAVLSAVMFAGALARSPVRDILQDGVKVKMWGQIDIYAPRGNYQLIVRQAWVDGAGALAAKFEELKKRLGAEGLFDSARKRPLPFLPHHIGIITASSGAVIHDMCTVITRRFPHIRITLRPARVQGAGAAEELAAALVAFNETPEADRPDVLIIGRGGGSIEDLWAFNEEILVRAVAASKIPVISAVGHETDFTLCDFAADVRAGTPSIAGEIVVRVFEDLWATVENLASRLKCAPAQRVEFWTQGLDHLSERLTTALGMWEERLCARLNEAQVRLNLLNPYAVLNRGYSLTLSPTGAVVRHVNDVKAGDEIITRLAAGEIHSIVQKSEK